MNQFNFSPCKYLPLSFCLAAPLLFAGCNSTPPPAPPVLIPRPRPTRRPVTLRATPKPLDLSKFAQAFPIPAAKLPEPNGYDLLVRAGESIQPGGEGTPATSEKLTPEEDVQRQRAFTAKNAQALDLMRQALPMTIMVPPARGAFVQQPPYAKFRALARLAMQRSRVYAADGQWDKAINSALDIVQMGTELQNGGNTLGLLVGSAIQSLGYKDLPRWVAKCDARTAEAAVRRMQTLEDKMATFHAIMPETKWDGMVSLQSVLANPNWRDEKGMSQLLSNPAERKRALTFSDHQILRNYAATMDKAIAQSKLPFNRNAQPVPPSADPLSAYFTKLYTDAAGNQNTLRRSTRWARTFAIHRLLKTSFALQEFEKHSGQYPASLNALTGKYWPVEPRDPFAPTQPLIYRRDSNDFTLYSVGPDTIDDGGSPITTININETTLGDIVFSFGVLNDGRPQNL